ncbi:InlB B-repeat-containing protein [Allochromatium palmeri]|uniref:Bacterial repeat domain-containing protein n=1 Tax=Allochromatium palmeri TaxID=231048 RepID=A0A6N8EI18_9GAMM|nr:pre-peptidase C-terminal domain-containing protein [Allochromatium palmeri]MTW22678.1 hypothetical protein [Allochromatium palmeri]
MKIYNVLFIGILLNMGACFSLLAGETTPESAGQLDATDEQNEVEQREILLNKINSEAVTDIMRPLYGVILDEMPSAVGSPNFHGEFNRYSESAELTLWRQAINGVERLFVQVQPTTSSFWFCPSGHSFSILQREVEYGEAFRATRGDNDSVCERLYATEIFLIDQWSIYDNFDESDAFVISYSDSSSSYSGTVSVNAAIATSNDQTIVFPATGDTRVIAVGTRPWNAGDYIEGVRTFDRGSANIDVILELGDNRLTCDTQDHFVKIDGEILNFLSIYPGDTVLSFSIPYAFFAAGDHVLRLQTVRTVSDGCGSVEIPDDLSTWTIKPSDTECSSELTPISTGQSLSGSLSETDCISPFAFGFANYYDNFTFTATADVEYTIDLTGDFDTYLYLIDSQGQVIASNDDYEGINSRIIYTPLTSETLTIHATSLWEEEVGAYQVSLAASESVCNSDETAITPGQSLSGSLSKTDCLSPFRYSNYYDNFTFTATAGLTYTIDLASSFDTYLYLLDSQGQIIAANDDYAGNNSRIIYTPSVSQTLTIHATSYLEGQTGTYQVALAAVNVITHNISPVANPSGGGTVTCDPNPVSNGQDSACIAIPNSGYNFSGWSGDCSGTDPSCTLSNVTATKSVTANFTRNQYQIATAASPSVGGTLSCTPNPVEQDASSTCTAIPAAGYSFSQWSGDCSGNSTSCTLSNVTSNKSVTAIFIGAAPVTHDIRASASPTEGGTVACTPNPVKNGAGSICTASPNSGYLFDKWSGDCTGIDPNCALSNVTAAKTVTANFVRNQYPIVTAASPTEGGTVTCTPNPVDHGGSSTCTASPASGYAFSNWNGDCTGTDSSCTLNNILSTRSVTGRFIAAGDGPQATHAASGYVPGALLTITNSFNDTSGETPRSLVWIPLLPTGWNIVDVTGDGAPQVVKNEIVFNGSLRLPINFSYRVSVPQEEIGTQDIEARVRYTSDMMINPITMYPEPKPLTLQQYPVKRHSADYAPDWAINAEEYSRVLMYWRAGAYHRNTEGLDSYAQDPGDTTGDRHSADYQDPAWRIDSFEANRVLAYWRALNYHVEPDSLDGYGPGALQTGSTLGVRANTIAAATVDPQATHTASPNQYTAGGTLTISNTVGQSGDRPLISLLWLPKLPSGWTIMAVSGQGDPELDRNNPNHILFTGTLTLPLTFSYTVQVPATAGGDQTLQADFQYWWNDQSMVDPATAPLEPLMVRSDSGPVGDCSRSEFVLNTPITSGTQTKRSEVGIRTTGTVRVAPGATLNLTAPRLVFEPGFSVESGGRLTAISAPVTCTAASAQSASVSNAIAPEPVETFAPGFIASADTLPSWLLEHLAEFGVDTDALTGGLLDADERWLILETTQALHPEDGNEASDLYRLDLLTDDIALISVTETGQAGNGASRDPAADTLGERVVFSSAASDLVPGDENGVSDLFLRDLVLGVTERLTQAEQASAHPAVDAEGSVLVYDQTTDAGPRQILGQALIDGAAAKVVPLSEADAWIDAHHPAISADGRFLAYLSQTTGADEVPSCTLVLRDFATDLAQRQPCPQVLDADSEAARMIFSPAGNRLFWYPSGQSQPIVLENPLTEAFSQP